MIVKFSSFKFHNVLSSRVIASIYLIVMCVLILPLEKSAISPIKVGLMALAPLLFIIKVPYMSKAVVWGVSYWGMCYFSALFAGGMRFSTLGFLGMYIITYIVFYNMIHSKVFSFEYFLKVIKYLIITFGVVLIVQQMFMLIGIRNFPFINLVSQGYASLTKLPSLTLEPSHTARIITVSMLGYLRCWELKSNRKMSLTELFSKEHKLVTVLFLWVILTQGSGTGFIGLGVLSLYFITRKSAIYVLPILFIFVSLGSFFELKQMERSVNLIETTISSKGDIKMMKDAEGSGAVRILPIVNTLTKTDLTDSKTWFGKGTVSITDRNNWWKKNDLKIGVIDQYGMIAFILSVIFVYSCMIKRFFCLETLIFIGLLGCSLANIYYTWGCVMIFTVVRYFQEQKEQGILELDKDE